MRDDDLELFAANGAAPLHETAETGHVESDGARIWYAAHGSGPPVIMLHGGLGHSGNFGYQAPALADAGYRVILIDSRGHGRSTRDDRPYAYTRMASDVLAVMDHLKLEKPSLIGWSDGACIGLILADIHPERVEKLFFFACNMDASGTKVMEDSKALGNCFGRHRTDYVQLSATPDNFNRFVADVTQMMETQPNYTAEQLSGIRVPVTLAIGEGDEFIKREHMEYLARTIPKSELRILPGVTHFAPLQRPEEFNAELLRFLGC